MTSTTIFDSQGKVKLIINSNGAYKSILDSSGRVLGSIRDGRTFDASGKLLSHGEDISAIVVNK